MPIQFVANFRLHIERGCFLDLSQTNALTMFFITESDSIHELIISYYNSMTRSTSSGPQRNEDIKITSLHCNKCK